MPRDLREGPIVINLSGERAERLARSLLAPQTGQAADRLWSELAALAGGGQRIAHDWDPATGRLTLIAGGTGPGAEAAHADLAWPPSTRRH